MLDGSGLGADKAMLPAFLKNENLKLLIFGGKGGTGKTTSAAAAALALAKRDPTKKVLLISTDPAHSLGDSFGIPIGEAKTPIDGVTNLSVMEMDPSILLARFKDEHAREIDEMVKRAGFYGQINLKAFLTFSLSGMEEMMTFLDIAKMYKFTWYEPAEADLVVLDTAPTGHTLQLLDMPQTMDDWVAAVDMALTKYRRHPRLYASGSQYKEGDFIDQFVEQLVQDFATMKDLLMNGQEAGFVPVIIPEAMSILETEDLIATLNEKGITVNSVVVNRVRSGGACAFCGSKMEDQSGSMAEIERKFDQYHLIEVPLFPYEVQGMTSLEEYAGFFVGSGKSFVMTRADGHAGLPSSATAVPQSPIILPDIPFWMFGGKGGVGKTTMAAATAVHMAQKHPDKSVLIYSIDPAHSVSDSFDHPVGSDIPVSIPGVGILSAMEINTHTILKDFMGRYKGIINEAFETWERKIVGKQLELRYDRNTVAMYSRTHPTGMSEVFALEKIVEFINEKKFDMYILDLAPTGHLLKLLEFPHLVRDWLSRSYRALIKYHTQYPLPQLVEALGDTILNSTVLINQARLLFSSPEKSRFVTVTISEAMGVQETERLVASLARLNIPCDHILVNMLTPPSECGFCSSRREVEQKYLKQMAEDHPDYAITPVPLFPYQITGVERLMEISRTVYGSSDVETFTTSGRGCD